MAFDEKQLKKLSAPRSGNTQYQRHSKYAALEELIENAKNGVTNDLVMDDQPQHQVSKCPITQKPINKPFKNECGHVYEHEAIVQFTKGKSGIKR
jgi:SUMO ligase MMS21 Smc5/6 complex component